MKSKNQEKLEEIVTKARSITEKAAEERTSEDETELASLIETGAKYRKALAEEKTVDEFARTIADGGPSRTEPANEIFLGRVPGLNYAVTAERKGFDSAVRAWRAKDKQPWGFDIRFKADVDNAVAEVNSGSVTDPGNAPQPQYGGVVQPFYYPGIIEPPTRQPMVADLFAQGGTDSNLVRLVKETTTVNNSGATAEGAPYGTVKIEVSPVDWPVKDITALLPVTEDALMDIPAMSAYLSMRLSKFVQLAEEGELLNGNGTGVHLAGILHLDDITEADQGADDVATAVMKLNAAVYAASFLDPTWIAMSPTTWARYVTARTDLNGGFGQFLAGNVTQPGARNMWGIPITVTPVIPDDKIIVGNPAAGMIFRNGGMRVESSTGYGTFFGEGLVAIRGKVRTAFAVFRPQAIGVLTLGSGS